MMSMPLENVNTVTALEPLPISFDEAAHAYTWKPTGQRLIYSVTEILQCLKSPQVLKRIDETKHVWGPRGTHVHWCLEQFLNGTPREELLGSDFDDWVKPLLWHPFWDHFRVIATEYRVCDLRRSIGGSLDALGVYSLTDDPKDDVLVLLDLKTLGSIHRSPYDVRPQLGGYLSMLIDQKKLLVDHCLVFWAWPGEADHGDLLSPDECLQAWEHTYEGVWMAEQEVL
mgnify:CR=1 FL=1